MRSHRATTTVLCLLLAFAWSLAGLSQTAPTAQPLPYAQNFGASTFTALPAGLAAWSGLSGASITTAALAASSVPTQNATLVAASTVQTGGGSYGYATASNGRYYVQTSSNTSVGVNQLALALDTTGWMSITLGYSVEIVSAQPRTVGVVCQYRVGTTGAWTTLTPATGQNPFSQAAGTAGIQTTPSITLPPAAENQPIVQIRWATWRGTETGSSSGLAIDDITVTGSAITTTLTATLSPDTVVESAGANATTLTVSRTGSTAAALPVTLVIDDVTEAAYDGPNPFSIAAGQSSVSIPIRAIDDDGLDGTQSVNLRVSASGALPVSATLSVLDDEDAYSPPIAYYSTAAGLIGTPLKAALKTIASPANYVQYTYSDTYTPIRAIYEDPANTSNVLTVYSGASLAKTAAYFPGGPSPDVSWSREHVWPESYGLDPTNVNPGSTGGDAGADFTDLFNLRPCIQTVNAQRNNLYYDETFGTPIISSLAPLCSRDGNSFEPREVEKGELARTIFYMATRYDGTDPLTVDLELSTVPDIANFKFGNVATLLRWNEDNPVTATERQRNQLIFSTYQRNRNPFIDHPEYIDLIWGNVRLSKTEGAVTEGWAADSYTVVLGAAPTADVTIALTPSAATQLQVSPSSLTFTPANWATPQTVTVTAVNDTTYETLTTSNIQHSVTSSDARYAAFVPLDFVATITDDDPLIPPASLPLSYGGPWDSLPTSFLGVGLGSPYPGSLGGDTATGSAKFDTTGDQLTIAFNAAPSTLTYWLVGNPSSGQSITATFTIAESVNGVDFTTVRTVVNKSSTSQSFSDTLQPTSRFVRFYFDKTAGNLQMDNLAIGAAPPFTDWASGFGLAGASADPLLDSDQDGLPNLLEFTLGGSPIGAESTSRAPQYQVVAGNLQMTAIVRSSQAITVFGQTTDTVSDAGSWTTSGVTQLSGVDQTGVANGFTRVIYQVPASGSTRYLRLGVTLP